MLALVWSSCTRVLMLLDQKGYKKSFLSVIGTEDRMVRIKMEDAVLVLRSTTQLARASKLSEN